MKLLNLYAGLGGNRTLWKGTQITAVEKDEKVAMVYRKLYPKDKVVVDDAHGYLLKNWQNFDAIWSSPPCVTHSILNYTLKTKRYPDLKLYEEIIFLLYMCKKPFVVENVRGYYKPLLEPTATIGHNHFWSHKPIYPFECRKFAGIGNNLREREYTIRKLEFNMIPKSVITLVMDLKRPRQIVDNMVDPYVGKHVFKCVF